MIQRHCISNVTLPMKDINTITWDSHFVRICQWAEEASTEYLVCPVLQLPGNCPLSPYSGILEPSFPIHGRCILPKLWYFSPLSEMDCQSGDQVGPRLPLPWRFGIRTRRFQQSRTEERYDLGRDLLVEGIFCPWSGEQRQCAGREKNGDSRGSGDWGWRAPPDFSTVLRALVAADYQSPATSLPLGSVRQSHSS